MGQGNLGVHPQIQIIQGKKIHGVNKKIGGETSNRGVQKGKHALPRNCNGRGNLSRQAKGGVTLKGRRTETPRSRKLRITTTSEVLNGRQFKNCPSHKKGVKKWIAKMERYLMNRITGKM